MAKLIGNLPSQIPTNGDLGDLAYQNKESVKVEAFESNGIDDNATSTAMTIDSSGQVGIGTTSPQRRLTVGAGSNSEILSIYAGSGLSSAIHFTDTNTTTDYQGFVTYAHGVDALRFGTAESERMRIDSSGNLDMTASGSGNIKIKNGNGIDFSASQGGYASSSLLDDYEEGLWYPTYTPQTGSFTTMPNNRYAYYVKVGGMVTVSAWIYTSTAVDVTGASGTLYISGLPFTPVFTNSKHSGAVGRAFNFAGEKPDSVVASSGSTRLDLFHHDSSTSNYSVLDVSDLQSGAYTNQNQIYFTLTYQTS